MRTKMRRAGAIVAALAAATAAHAAGGTDAYQALGVDPGKVISGTVIRSKVIPGAKQQLVCVATYFTGDRDPARAANVRVGVFDESGEELVPVYTRDLGEEHDGQVGNGDLQLLDLDRDGVNEMVITWDDFSDPLIDQRWAEVVMHDDGAGMHSAWTGHVEYDATRAAREIPAERRDRFKREIDIAATMRSRGRTLWMVKKVIAIAGERLPAPREVEESFPLRGDVGP